LKTPVASSVHGYLTRAGGLTSGRRMLRRALL